MLKQKLGPLYPFALSAFLLLVFLTCTRLALAGLFIDHILNTGQLFTILINGIRMDLVITAYLFAIPILLFISVDTYLKIASPLVTKIMVYWTTFVFLAITFLETITPLYILEYGVRPERKLFEYLGHSKEVITMLSPFLTYLFRKYELVN